MAKLTHIGSDGTARMVDIGDKQDSRREARASGRIRMQAATLAMVRDGLAKKGDVLAVARIAGIMAAKKTAELIPLCHALALDAVSVDFEILADEPAIACTAYATTNDRTGVEMEALTAVQIALLTIYDMCKAIDRGMVISDIRLESKLGGRSGSWQREA